MARIYTRTGDGGTTGRFLGGRISKGDELVEVSGDVDEAIAVLGVARAGCSIPDLAELLLRLQREMFVVGADLAVNPAHRDRLEDGTSRVTVAMVAALEELIDELVTRRPLRPVFVVPGAAPTSAVLDHARTVVRRAERHTVRAAEAGHVVTEEVRLYLNRLSDLVFVLGRHAAGETEEPASH